MIEEEEAYMSEEKKNEVLDQEKELDESEMEAVSGGIDFCIAVGDKKKECFCPLGGGGKTKCSCPIVGSGD